MFIETTSLMAGLAGIFTSALALLAEQPAVGVHPLLEGDVVTSLPVVLPPEVIEVLAHKTLRLYCLLGSLGGGVIGVGITPTGTAREQAWKWTTGTIAGVVFTPAIMRLCSIPVTPDYVVPTAAIIAVVAWGTFQKLLPIFDRWIIRRARQFLGDTSDPTTRP